jgi:hypothetical protein
MKKISIGRDTSLILATFLLSRIIVSLFGVRLDYEALYRNWQYLDVRTLRDSLISGIWYDHTQPPVFNFLLGIVVQSTGKFAPTVFILALKAISLINALLLLRIGKRLLPAPATGQPSIIRHLPLIISLLYLLSPATILFENELFYTSFISLLFLISAISLLSLQQTIDWKNTAGFLLPLLAIAMTRSMYHLVWLLVIIVAIAGFYRKKAGVLRIATVGLLVLLLAGGWYVRNYLLFGSFSSSTWMGMNLARNVYHDAPTTDSSDIASVEPFSPISAYKPWLSPADTARFTGVGGRDLHEVMKNDSFINEKHAAYITVSRLYMESCKRQIKAHPLRVLSNIAQSAIIFFAPATRYTVNEYQAKKIMYYDFLYSFNLSHFAKGKQQRRIALTLSAIPKLLIYLLVFGWWCRRIIRTRSIDALTAFLFLVMAYVFCLSSVFEQYENMRFRYEVEPLFLILAGQAIAGWLQTRPGLKNGQSAIGDGRIKLPQDPLPERP